MAALSSLDVSLSVADFFQAIYSASHWEKLRLALSSSPTETYFRIIVPPNHSPDLDFNAAASKRRAEILPRLQQAIDKV